MFKFKIIVFFFLVSIGFKLNAQDGNIRLVEKSEFKKMLNTNSDAKAYAHGLRVDLLQAYTLAIVETEFNTRIKGFLNGVISTRYQIIPDAGNRLLINKPNYSIKKLNGIGIGFYVGSKRPLTASSHGVLGFRYYRYAAQKYTPNPNLPNISSTAIPYEFAFDAFLRTRLNRITLDYGLQWFHRDIKIKRDFGTQADDFLNAGLREGVLVNLKLGYLF